MTTKQTPKDEELRYDFNPTDEQREEQLGDNVVELRAELEAVWDLLDPIDMERAPLINREKRLKNKIAGLTSASIEKNQKNRR